MRSALLGPIVDRIKELWSMRIGALFLIVGLVGYPFAPNRPYNTADAPLEAFRSVHEKIGAERCVIVNADDFGQSPGVNRGIIEAHQHGIVTSASLMVNWPAAAEAAAYGRAHADLSLGLHFDVGEWCYRNEKWIVLVRSSGFAFSARPISTRMGPNGERQRTPAPTE